MRFTVNLSQPYDWLVTVDWSTADGSAIAGGDYYECGSGARRLL